jgi:hypothetical protein
MSDEELSQRLSELPRYTAPASLRVAIVEATTPRRRGLAWFSPLVTAAATALVLALVFLPMLRHGAAGDPTTRLVDSVVAEHTRVLLWGARREVMPTGLSSLTPEAGIGLARVFMGDDEFTFLGAEPVYLDGRRGIAVHYRDIRGELVSYVILPAPGLPIPAQKRVQVDRFKPALIREQGFGAWVWTEGKVACVLVAKMDSDRDLDRFKDYFLRVRTTSEPYVAS